MPGGRRVTVDAVGRLLMVETPRHLPPRKEIFAAESFIKGFSFATPVQECDKSFAKFLHDDHIGKQMSNVFSLSSKEAQIEKLYKSGSR